MNSTPNQLKINEIFYSLQGESTQMGRPCIFIRLSGCKLRCTYCDTQYAYFEGNFLSIDAILEQIRSYPCGLVEVTGGEPLEQKNCIPLLERLVEQGYEVMLETDGVEDIQLVPQGVKIIFDIKTPGSGMQSSKTLKNLANLRAGDEIKFVLCDESDYEFARNFVKEHDLLRRFTVLFSPVYRSESAGGIGWLAPLVLRDGLSVRFQPQLHKILWGEQRGV